MSPVTRPRQGTTPIPVTLVLGDSEWGRRESVLLLSLVGVEDSSCLGGCRWRTTWTCRRGCGLVWEELLVEVISRRPVYRRRSGTHSDPTRVEHQHQRLGLRLPRRPGAVVPAVRYVQLLLQPVGEVMVDEEVLPDPSVSEVHP